jgi:hypothetical protein
MAHERVTRLVESNKRLAEEIERLRAIINPGDAAAYEEEHAAMLSALLSPAPCRVCGYSGPGYYQPETHSCAAEVRALPGEPKRVVHAPGCSGESGVLDLCECDPIAVPEPPAPLSPEIEEKVREIFRDIGYSGGNAERRMLALLRDLGQERSK